MIVMRKTNKIALFLLVCILFISIFTLPASAKTYTGTQSGYHSDYIYVHTNKANATIPLTFTKGTINTSKQFCDYNMKSATNSYDRYASYEIKVYYWNGSQYVKETSYDVYNKASNTITLKRKNTDYKIQVYQWKVKTTYDSYKKNGIVPSRYNGTMNLSVGSGIKDDDPFWIKLPKFSTGTLKNCTIYSKNPH